MADREKRKGTPPAGRNIQVKSPAGFRFSSSALNNSPPYIAAAAAAAAAAVKGSESDASPIDPDELHHPLLLLLPLLRLSSCLLLPLAHPPSLPPSLSNPLAPSPPAPPPPLLSAVDALLTYSMDSGGEGEEGWMEDQWEKWLTHDISLDEFEDDDLSEITEITDECGMSLNCNGPDIKMHHWYPSFCHLQLYSSSKILPRKCFKQLKEVYRVSAPIGQKKEKKILHAVKE
ncbi:C-Jun-amino-terminal kinase-interacting protein 1 [Collichthys lucidus]|uniref:C-Jun-amino-terminal kinase-interacting protein 1 n=1 Tax=Collichthys lucidus TaxID=240159 RepID=A0A4U5U759_COLLU|nr:C-Jun-amino-terminal kinase-interacting protein 1 [Collichthys lucidus]